MQILALTGPREHMPFCPILLVNYLTFAVMSTKITFARFFL